MLDCGPARAHRMPFAQGLPRDYQLTASMGPPADCGHQPAAIISH